MHELSITESVVETIVDRMGDARVVRVALQIGMLSGVVVDSVRFCFELVTAGTTLEGARLEVDEPHGTVRCRSCGKDSVVTTLLAVCSCGGVELDVVSGDQLRITEVEVSADVCDVRLR